MWLADKALKLCLALLQVTYSTLIDGCVRKGDVDTGKQLLTEMVAAGVKPNAVTYNTLLRAYALDDKVDMKVTLHGPTVTACMQEPPFIYTRVCHMVSCWSRCSCASGYRLDPLHSTAVAHVLGHHILNMPCLSPLLYECCYSTRVGNVCQCSAAEMYFRHSRPCCA